MNQKPEEQAIKVELNLDESTLDKIKKIIQLIGFTRVEEFLDVAIKKELDYYTLLLGYKGTDKKKT
jgi:hypothetical protein